MATSTSSLDSGDLSSIIDEFPTIDIHHHFAEILSNIKSKNVRPDFLASVITHYASKWLPELASADPLVKPANMCLKKRVFVEHLVSILPPEKDSMSCDFLLRLLRVARMVGAESVHLDDLEACVAYQLGQASLKEVMIPSFSDDTYGTMLDVRLLIRLVNKFLAMEETARSGAAMVKVARLVDSYLAKVALEHALTVAEFGQLAVSVPSHARANDDGLYWAVDMFIRAHQNITKEEKNALSRLIDPRKLSFHTSLHAIHNDCLPVRTVIQVLYSEQTKLNLIGDRSRGSFSGLRSPGPAVETPPDRCPSNREVVSQQHDVRKLRDDVAQLHTQCRALQAQIDVLGGLGTKKKKGIFGWRSGFFFRGREPTDKTIVNGYEVGLECRTPPTPVDSRKVVHGTARRRSSMS